MKLRSSRGRGKTARRRATDERLQNSGPRLRRPPDHEIIMKARVDFDWVSVAWRQHERVV
jgi:hypothetical protein